MPNGYPASTGETMKPHTEPWFDMTAVRRERTQQRLKVKHFRTLFQFVDEIRSQWATRPPTTVELLVEADPEYTGFFVAATESDVLFTIEPVSGGFLLRERR
jgi:hypothetical protein